MEGSRQKLESKNKHKLSYLGERVFFEWRAPEYRNFKKLKTYTPAILAVAGLLMLWALYFSNFIFAFLLLIIGVAVLLVGSGRPPKPHRFAVTDSGLWIGNELKAFISCKYFSVVPYATKQDRFFLFRLSKGGSFRLPVPIENAERIRLTINKYVPQKEYTGNFFDLFDKIFW